jgi:tartrate-resistant acid phosphatase type 5
MKRFVICFAGLAFLLVGCTTPSNISTYTLTSTIAVLPTHTSFPSDTPLPTETPSPTVTPAPSSTPQPPTPVRFAVIGDYGKQGVAEEDVSALVHGWHPDFIITVGDNNYSEGSAETIDANIGRYYHDYIFPYKGAYGSGADINRFFPSLGNHDWYTKDAQSYLDYFTLPGKERYYDFAWGSLHFFALDSDEHEPDGINEGSVQAAWLKQALAASTSTWNIVYFHHPPYNSGHYGPTLWMRWPFASWGAEAVFAGHEHLYERLLVDGIPYFIDGAGGNGLYNFGDTAPESMFRYNANYGGMLVTASQSDMLFEFYNRVGVLIDSYRVIKP